MANANSTVERTAESHPKAELTDHEVELLRELAENGMTCVQIAARFEEQSRH